MSDYYNNLIQEVLNNSESIYWESAVKEWQIDDVEEDESLSQSCICGHPNLKYLFTIKNMVNNNVLFPIGSECIKKFERDDLYQEATLKEQLFKLYHAVENQKFISLNSELFSRKLLKYLYDINAFKSTQYNNYNPSGDYQFLLDMFNKRNKTSLQEKKVKAILLNSIKPFIVSKLTSKVK